MSDTEVMRYGTSLASPYARHEDIAAKISDYIAGAAVEQTGNSFTTVTYDEINKRFKTYMQDDEHLKKEIGERLENDHSDVISHAVMLEKGVFLDIDLNENMSETNNESMTETWGLSM